MAEPNPFESPPETPEEKWASISLLRAFVVLVALTAATMLGVPVFLAVMYLIGEGGLDGFFWSPSEIAAALAGLLGCALVGIGVMQRWKRWAVMGVVLLVVGLSMWVAL